MTPIIDCSWVRAGPKIDGFQVEADESRLEGSRCELWGKETKTLNPKLGHEVGIKEDIFSGV